MDHFQTIEWTKMTTPSEITDAIYFTLNQPRWKNLTPTQINSGNCGNFIFI